MKTDRVNRAPPNSLDSSPSSSPANSPSPSRRKRSNGPLKLSTGAWVGTEILLNPTRAQEGSPKPAGNKIVAGENLTEGVARILGINPKEVLTAGLMVPSTGVQQVSADRHTIELRPFQPFYDELNLFVTTIETYRNLRNQAIDQERETAHRPDAAAGVDGDNVLDLEGIKAAKGAFFRAALAAIETGVDQLEESDVTLDATLDSALKEFLSKLGRNFSDIIGTSDDSTELRTLYQVYRKLEAEAQRDIPVLDSSTLIDITRKARECLEALIPQKGSLMGNKAHASKGAAIKLDEKYRPIIRALEHFLEVPSEVQGVTVEEFQKKFAQESHKILAPNQLTHTIAQKAADLLANNSLPAAKANRQIILCQGVPGTGKSTAIMAIIEMTGVPIANFTMAELINSYKIEFGVTSFKPASHPTNPQPVVAGQLAPPPAGSTAGTQSTNTDRGTAAANANSHHPTKPKPMAFSEFLKQKMLRTMREKKCANLVFLLDDWHVLYQNGGPYEDGNNAEDLRNLLNFLKELGTSSTSNPFGSTTFKPEDDAKGLTATINEGGARTAVFITSNETIQDRLSKLPKASNLGEYSALFERMTEAKCIIDADARRKVVGVYIQNIRAELADCLEEQDLIAIVATAELILRKDLAWYSTQAPGTRGFRGLANFMGMLKQKCYGFKTNAADTRNELADFRKHIDHHFSSINAYHCAVDESMASEAFGFFIANEIKTLMDEVTAAQMNDQLKQRIINLLEQLKRSKDTPNTRSKNLETIKGIFDAYRKLPANLPSSDEKSKEVLSALASSYPSYSFAGTDDDAEPEGVVDDGDPFSSIKIVSPKPSEEGVDIDQIVLQVHSTVGANQQKLLNPQFPPNPGTVILMATDDGAQPKDPREIMDPTGNGEAHVVYIADSPFSQEVGTGSFTLQELTDMQLDGILTITGAQAQFGEEDTKEQCSVIKDACADGRVRFALQSPKGAKKYLNKEGIQEILAAVKSGGTAVMTGNKTTNKDGGDAKLNIFERYHLNSGGQLLGAIVLDIRNSRDDILDAVRPRFGNDSGRGIDDTPSWEKFISKLMTAINREPHGLEPDNRGITVFLICGEKDAMVLDPLMDRHKTIKWPQRIISEAQHRLDEFDHKSGIRKSGKNEVLDYKQLQQFDPKESAGDYLNLLRKQWCDIDAVYLAACAKEGLIPHTRPVHDAAVATSLFKQLATNRTLNLSSQCAQTQRNMKELYRDALKSQIAEKEKQAMREEDAKALKAAKLRALESSGAPAKAHA